MAQQFQPQKFIRRLLSSRVFLFFAIIVLIYLVINLGRESYRKHQLNKEVNELKSEIGRLEGKNQQLADMMEYFKNESYLEKEARLKLNLKKPGEKVVILSDSFPDTQPALENGGENSQNNESTVETANYWKWWEYFFNP